MILLEVEFSYRIIIDMISGSGNSVVHNDKAIGDLFFADGGFRFSDDLAAYKRFSRKLFELTGRPILVVNLADLPFAYKDHNSIPPMGKEPFEDYQIKEREKKLRQIWQDTYPDNNIALLPTSENWLKATANNAAPNAGSLIADRKLKPPPSILTPHIEGDIWKEAAIILVPDRDWSAISLWARRTALNEESITKYPKGEGSKIESFLHELGHFMTCERPTLGDEPSDGERWHNEKGADKIAIKYGTILANDPRAPTASVRSIKLAMALEAPVRALARFLNAPGPYGTGLAIDCDVKGSGVASFERVCAAEDELRWRCYETLLYQQGRRAEHLSIKDDSRIVQNTIAAWRRGEKLADRDLEKPIKNACMYSLTMEHLPILHDVVMNHPVTDPLALRSGELALYAAKFSCPHIFNVRATEHRASAEVFRARNSSWWGKQAFAVPPIPAWLIPKVGARAAAYAL